MYFRILMTILIGMFIALVIIRIFAASMGGSPENIMGRVYQARAELPEIASEARENDTLIFFGSSMVEAGFSPREFEQMLDEKDVKNSCLEFRLWRPEPALPGFSGPDAFAIHSWRMMRD